MKREYHNSITGTALTALAIFVSASCSPAATGNPVPATTTDPSEIRPSDNSSAEVPRVDNPLDTTRFLPRPCTVLTQSQLNSFDITQPGEPTTTGAIAEQVGPWCAWSASEAQGGISVGFLTNNTGGMTDVYNSRASFDYFEPTTVDGYPGVFAETQDLRKNGSCGIIVAVSDTTTFRASEEGALDAQGACDRAKQVAAAALATIRGDS